jgi:hypothetical protein
MKRFMQLVLVVNVALAAVSGFAGYLLHVSSIQPEGVEAGAEPILGHALAAIYLGFMVTLVVALLRFQRDPIWLLVPAFFVFPLWIDALYELSVVGTSGIGPAVVRPILVACYIVGYLVLRRRTRDHPATTATATGRSGAAATS